MGKFFSYLKNFDWYLFVSAMLLVVLGLISLYSIALSQDNPDFLIFKKQLLFIGLGLILLIFFAILDYKLLANYSWWLIGFGLVLLVVVLIFGVNIRGTRGWLYVGSISIQPVEIFKIFLIIFLSSYFSKKLPEMGKLKTVLISALWVFGFMILVALQPDLGAATILFIVWLGIMLFAGVRKKHLLVIFLILVIIFGSSWFFLRDYQKDRIMTFVDPSLDPYGRGYNLKQSIIAVGAGQWVGRGFASGSQSQLKFLPESQNDFIFAVIAEELGLVGALLVLFIFFVLFFRLLRIAKNARDEVGMFMVLGIFVLIFSQFVINIGMNIGLLPIIGLSLPLISYGGSGLLTVFVLLGIAQSVKLRGGIVK